MISIAIIIPVLGRPQQIQPVLDSIAFATTDINHRVIFVCSPNDKTRKVCQKTDAETLVVDWKPGRADFARKINYAFGQTDEKWIFQGATDLNFHPRWANNALHVAHNTGVGVIGTNDLGNPIVKRGNHATHILFSRDYIDQYGGTYDGTGIVFSEAYSHQFVDTEFIQTAMQRGQFKPCLRSIVEHLHPHWGKGEMDDTYVKSEQDFREDSKIYGKRIREIRSMAGGRPPARRR